MFPGNIVCAICFTSVYFCFLTRFTGVCLCVPWKPTVAALGRAASRGFPAAPTAPSGRNGGAEALLADDGEQGALCWVLHQLRDQNILSTRRGIHLGSDKRPSAGGHRRLHPREQNRYFDRFAYVSCFFHEFKQVRLGSFSHEITVFVLSVQQVQEFVLLIIAREIVGQIA